MSASYIINANSVILSVLEFYFLFLVLAVLFRLNELRVQTNVPLFCLLAGASLFIHLISSALTSTSSLVLLSNSPWTQERRENREKSSASPEQRRGARGYTWYDSILSLNEAHMALKITYNFYLQCLFPCEPHFCPQFPLSLCKVGVLQWMISPKSNRFHSSRHMLNQRVKQQKELADRLFSVRCWQHRHEAFVTVNRRLGAGESRCMKPVLWTDECFCPFTITASQHWSLLACDLHWHL